MNPIEISQPLLNEEGLSVKPIIQIPVLPVEVLPDYIHSKMEMEMEIETETEICSKPMIMIYHFIVGSYTMEENIDNPNPKLKRNHEFPQVVKNLLYNPELQFSPEMQEYISHYEHFTIIQKLILIDPMYERNQNLIGLQKEITQRNELIQDGKIIKEYEIQHNEFKKTKIQSSLEPIVIPNNIDENQIIELIKIINGYRKQITVLVNLIDCSSRTLPHLYINNQNPFVYLSTPDCLLQDDTIQYMPVITIEEDDKHHNHQIRWCNYETDYKAIEDYKTVMDICKNARITYNFLINIFKRKKIEIDLLTIYKFLGILSVTKEYQLSNGKCFTFSKLTFPDFVELWQQRDISISFQNIFLGSFDQYFKENIKMYINTLTSNQQLLLQMNAHSSIKDILFQEAWNILRQLKEYFPDDEKIHLPENYLLVDRFKIRDYLEDNGVHQ